MKSQLRLLMKIFDNINIDGINNNNNNNINKAATNKNKSQTHVHVHAHAYDIKLTKISKLMKRFTILTYFTVLCTFIFVLGMMIVSIGFSSNANVALIAGLLNMIDIIVNITCIATQFSFADCIYKSICQRFETINIFVNINNLIQMTTTHQESQ